jgi:hypothetical protein
MSSKAHQRQRLDWLSAAAKSRSLNVDKVYPSNAPFADPARGVGGRSPPKGQRDVVIDIM